MKALIVFPSLNLGGANKQAVNLAKQLDSRGVEVVLFVFNTNRKGGITEQIPENIELIFSQFYLIAPFRILIKTVSLIQTIKTIKPDLIYTRLEYAPVTIAGKITGTPTVIAIVNTPESKARLWIKRIISNFLRNISSKLADSIVVNSQGLAKECKRHFNLKKEPVVIYNGTDVPLVRNMALQQASHEWTRNRTVPLVVTVGNLRRQKGQETLIDAFAILNKRIKSRLLVVGEGELRGLLTKQIKQLKLEDSVRLVGSQTNPYSFMASADLYVLSSVHEGFSNTLQEAAVLGLPIVSTDHEFGASELIEDGHNGMLVPVGNPKAMAEAMERVLTDSLLREKFSRAIKKQGEQFGIEKMCLKYEQLFREVLEK